MRGILILFKIVNRKLKYMVEIKIEYYTIKHIDGMFANISANDIESKEEGIEILNHDKFPGKWEIFNYDYDDSNEISFYIFHKLKEIVQSKFRQVVTNLTLKNYEKLERIVNEGYAEILLMQLICASIIFQNKYSWRVIIFL